MSKTRSKFGEGIFAEFAFDELQQKIISWSKIIFQMPGAILNIIKP